MDDGMETIAGTTGLAGGIQAQLGLSIEPLHVIQDHLAKAGMNQVSLVRPSSSSSVSPIVEPSLNDYVLITRRILEHFHNYVTSFLGGEGNDLANKAIQAWYQTIERKIKLDPDFWRKT